MCSSILSLHGVAFRRCSAVCYATSFCESLRVPECRFKEDERTEPLRKAIVGFAIAVQQSYRSARRLWLPRTDVTTKFPYFRCGGIIIQTALPAQRKLFPVIKLSSGSPLSCWMGWPRALFTVRSATGLFRHFPCYTGRHFTTQETQ